MPARGIAVSSPPAVTWLSSAARVYQIEYAPNLVTGPWTNLATSIAGSNAVISFTDTNDAPARSYRLKVKIP